MTVIHIWPTDNFDVVAVEVEQDGLISPVTRVDRDDLFTCLSHPSLRSRADDIIYHALPQ